MPAYDTPPPPPTDVLGHRPQRSGPVVIVLVVGFFILLFGLFGFRRIRMEREARLPREKSILKTAKLAKAALLYAEDHEFLPNGFSFEGQMKPYGVVSADFVSPISSYSRYTLRESGRRKISAIKNADRFALFFDGYGSASRSYPQPLQSAWQVNNYRKDSRPGNVFSFADGHSAFISQADWDPEETSSGPVQ